jgi:hydrogenase nickel incorporation protein HypB
MSSPRILQVRQNILAKNDRLAAELRAGFAAHGVLAVNFVSGPGAGKTELLRRTMAALRHDQRCAAVTGDLATANDAARLAESGAPARQILTGAMCHLEADMVATAIEDWELAELDYLFIENVGNLVCPGDFDLGEDLRVLLLATTEGEDKPLKYPTLINTADVVIINKLDLAAAVECDLPLLEANIRQMRPGAAIFQLSAKTGAGFEPWLTYLHTQWQAKQVASKQAASKQAANKQAGS